jgi:hypothetical protein
MRRVQKSFKVNALVASKKREIFLCHFGLLAEIHPVWADSSAKNESLDYKYRGKSVWISRSKKPNNGQ